MTRTTSAETEACWSAIDEQRRRTADLLERLDEQQWRQPSLCRGWTVRHVAAHLTLQQQRIRDIASFTARHPSMLRHPTLNRSIHHSAELRARLPTQEIVHRISGAIGSRRHNAFVTPLETLTDVLVHGQDIALPLGLDLDLPPTACALAATRQWDTRGTWLATVFRPLPLEAYRLTANDMEWSRGDGPPITGPIAAILLLLTGRTAALARLSGTGADALAAER